MFTSEARKFKLRAKTALPIVANELARDIGYLNPEHLVGTRDTNIHKIIREHGTLRKFQVADQIYPFEPDEPALLLMHRGAANLFIPSEPTPTFIKRIEEGFLFGEYPSIGLLMLGTRAEAATRAEVIILTQQAVKHIAAKHPDIAVGLLHEVGLRFAACQTEYKRTKFATLPSRIASLLLDLADGQGVVVGISERAIAERLAARRESVVAVISRMKRAGMVEVVSKQKFLLTNIGALQALKLF